MSSENRDKIVDFLNRNSKKIIFSTSAVAIILVVVLGGFLWQYSRPVAVVNGEEITRSEYNRETEIAQQTAEYMGGDTLTTSSKVKDDLVEKEIVRIAAEENNITVSDSEVDEKISQNSSSYDNDVDKLYSTYEAAYGYSKDELNEQVKYTLLKEKVEQVILGNKSGRCVSVRFNQQNRVEEQTGLTDTVEMDAWAKSEIDKYYQMLESGKTFDEVFQLAKNNEKYTYPVMFGYEFLDINAGSTSVGYPEEEVSAIMATAEDKYSLVTKTKTYYAIYYVDTAGTGKYGTWEEFINDYKTKYLAFNISDFKNTIANNFIKNYNKVALNIEKLTGVNVAMAVCQTDTNCTGSRIYGYVRDAVTEAGISGATVTISTSTPGISGVTFCGPKSGSVGTSSTGEYSIGPVNGYDCWINCGWENWSGTAAHSKYHTLTVPVNTENGSAYPWNPKLVPNVTLETFYYCSGTDCSHDDFTGEAACGKLHGTCYTSSNCNNACGTVTSGAPSCTLSADPSSIFSGKSSTLSWTTKNADSASINNSIGDVSTNGGTKSVSPSSYKKYTMTVKNKAGDSNSCWTTVTVDTVDDGYPEYFHCREDGSDACDLDFFESKDQCEESYGTCWPYSSDGKCGGTCGVSSDDPTTPTTPYVPYPACSILINGGAATTTSTDVTLSGFPTASGLDMIVWNEGDANAPGLDVPNDEYKPVPPSGTMSWNLGPTAFNFKEGNPTSRVFVKFRNSSGKKNGCVASIQYIRPACSFVVNGGDKTTKDENVTLSGFPSGVTQMVFWKEGEDLSGSEVVAGDGPATFEPFAPTKQMEVYPNIGMLTRFWARFKNATGDISWWCSGSITLVGEDDTTDDPPPSADNKPPTIEIVSPVGEDRVFTLPDGQDKMPITLTAKGVDPEGLDLSIAIMGSVNVSMPNGYSVWSGPISNPAVRSVTTEPLGPGLYGWQAGSAETLPDYDVCTKVCKTVENYLEEGKEISEKSVITTDCAEEDKIEECETVHVNNLTSDKVFGFFQIKERDIEPDLNCKIDITKGDAPLTVGAHVTGYTLGSGAYKIIDTPTFNYYFGTNKKKSKANPYEWVYYTFNKAGKYIVRLEMSGTGANGGASAECGVVNVTSPTEDSGGEISP